MAQKKLTRSVCTAALVTFGGLAACSSSSGEAPGGSSSGATAAPSNNAVNCPTWTEALDTYDANVSEKGTADDFIVTDISPPPPATGNTTWKLKIVDATGQPVKDATMTNIKTWMPQHSHPSTALPVPTNNGDGTYTIDNLYLYMPGVWQVTFNITTGSTTDSAMFTFCLGT
jgi:YtkA-like protein